MAVQTMANQTLFKLVGDERTIESHSLVVAFLLKLNVDLCPEMRSAGQPQSAT